MPQELPEQLVPRSLTSAAVPQPAPAAFQTSASLQPSVAVQGASQLSADQRATLMRDFASVVALQGESPASPNATAGCVGCSQDSAARGEQQGFGEPSVPMMPTQVVGSSAGFLLGEGRLQVLGGPASPAVQGMNGSLLVLNAYQQSASSPTPIPEQFFNVWDDSRVLGGKESKGGKSETRGGAFAGGSAPTHPDTNPAFGGVLAFRWKESGETVMEDCYYTYINYVTRSVRWYAYWGGGAEPKAEGSPKQYNQKRRLDNEGEEGVDPTKPESPLVKFGEHGGTVIKIDIPNMDLELARQIAMAAGARAPEAFKICVRVTWLLEAWLVLVCKGTVKYMTPVSRTTGTVRGYACFLTGTWQLLETGSEVTGGDDTTDGKSLSDGDKSDFEDDMSGYDPPWGEVRWSE